MNQGDVRFILVGFVTLYEGVFMIGFYWPIKSVENNTIDSSIRVE